MGALRRIVQSNARGMGTWDICEKRCCDLVRIAQRAGRPENKASEPYLSDMGVPLKGFLSKNTHHFLQKKGLGGLYPPCEDHLSYAVVAAEFWSLRKKCGSQRTNRVRRTLGTTGRRTLP